MLNTNKNHVIVMLESNEKDYIYYGKTENVNHVLVNSDATTFEIIEIKYFNNVSEFYQILEVIRKDFTNNELLQDALFYNCDEFIETNNINASETMVKLYDYNENIYSLLTEWMQAKDESKHKLNKDSKGYYIVTGLNIFNPNKLYLTEYDAKQYHKKQYLNIKLNELMKNTNNWTLKEMLTEKEFTARCNFLNNLGKVKILNDRKEVAEC